MRSVLLIVSCGREDPLWIEGKEVISQHPSSLKVSIQFAHSIRVLLQHLQKAPKDIQSVILLAHGTKTEMCIGDERLTSENAPIVLKGFERRFSDLTLVSCKVGKCLAGVIARATQTKVIASTRIVYGQDIIFNDHETMPPLNLLGPEVYTFNPDGTSEIHLSESPIEHLRFLLEFYSLNEARTLFKQILDKYGPLSITQCDYVISQLDIIFINILHIFLLDATNGTRFLADITSLVYRLLSIKTENIQDKTFIVYLIYEILKCKEINIQFTCAQAEQILQYGFTGDEELRRRAYDCLVLVTKNMSADDITSLVYHLLSIETENVQDKTFIIRLLHTILGREAVKIRFTSSHIEQILQYGQIFQYGFAGIEEFRGLEFDCLILIARASGKKKEIEELFSIETLKRTIPFLSDPNEIIKSNAAYFFHILARDLQEKAEEIFSPEIIALFKDLLSGSIEMIPLKFLLNTFTMFRNLAVHDKIRPLLISQEIPARIFDFLSHSNARVKQVVILFFSKLVYYFDITKMESFIEIMQAMERMIADSDEKIQNTVIYFFHELVSRLGHAKPFFSPELREKIGRFKDSPDAEIQKGAAAICEKLR